MVSPDSKEEIKEAVDQMMNDNIYEELKSNCNASFIEEKNKRQVDIYVQSILS